MRDCSLIALICALIILALLVVQGISGAVSAMRSRQVYPDDAVAAGAAVESFASSRGFHRIVGQLTVVPALVLVGFAIVFSLKARPYQPRHTRHPWLVTVGAVLILALCLGMLVQGMSYASNLRTANWWLVEPSGGFPQGTEAVQGQVVDSGTFTTFVAIHGVMLPFLTILIIIFIWPSFYEFAFEGGINLKKRSKWADITERRA